MNKIILSCNIKGGVGKTSTCALFAEYLHQKGYSVKVLDADIQASLSRHRNRELAANPSIIVPWEVSSIDTLATQMEWFPIAYHIVDKVALVVLPVLAYYTGKYNLDDTMFFLWLVAAMPVLAISILWAINELRDWVVRKKRH